MSATAKKAETAPKKRKSAGLRDLPASKFPHEKMLSNLGSSDSRAKRIAYYLDWAAREQPYHYQPFNVIVTAIQNYGALRRMDSEEVVSVRASMSSVRNLLQKTYGRDLDIAGNGALATVSDEHTASVPLPKKLRRLRSAKNSVLKTYNLIDMAKIKDPKIKAYLSKSVKEVIRLVGGEDFDKKLLPPKDDDK